MKGIRISLLLGVLGASAMCFAPIKDTRQNVKLEPEKPETVRQQEQNRFQGTQAPIVAPPEDTERNDSNIDSSDPSAANAIGTANKALGANGKQAKDDLSTAEKVLKKPKSEGKNWLFGAIFGILGFGVVLAFRQYANKVVPEMPSTAKKGTSPKNLNGDPIEVNVKKPKW